MSKRRSESAQRKARRNVLDPDAILNPPYVPPVFVLTQDVLRHVTLEGFKRELVAVAFCAVRARTQGSSGTSSNSRSDSTLNSPPSKQSGSRVSPARPFLSNPSKNQPTANRSLGREANTKRSQT